MSQKPLQVRQGETASRTLHHVAVVLLLNHMGPDVVDGRPLTLKLPGEPGDARPGAKLRLVVFPGDESAGRVLAVAERQINHQVSTGKEVEMGCCSIAATGQVPPGRRPGMFATLFGLAQGLDLALVHDHSIPFGRLVIPGCTIPCVGRHIVCNRLNGYDEG